MTAYVRETREVRRRTDDDMADHAVSDDGRTAQITAANIIWYIAGLVEALLALRFILALFGANPGNAFASLIYSLSYPLVAPFFGLFNYTLQNGVSRFEIFTLFAMAVYAIIAYAIAHLLTIDRPGDVEV